MKVIAYSNKIESDHPNNNNYHEIIQNYHLNTESAYANKGFGGLIFVYVITLIFRISILVIL